MFFTSIGTMANTVRISDPVGVLNASQVSSEGAKLSYALDIYTTNTYSGSAASFILRTISAHLSSKSLIVIAIDTVHHYLAIVNGSSVPLSKSRDTDAGTAFKNAGRAPLIGEKAQATLRGRPRGRLGTDGSGKGCLRGRPRGRLGSGGLAPAALRGRPGLLGSTQATGATLYIKSSRIRQM